MDGFQLLLILTAFLCTLVTGYLLVLDCSDARLICAERQSIQQPSNTPIASFRIAAIFFHVVGFYRFFRWSRCGFCNGCGFVESQALLALCIAYLVGVQAIGLIHIPMNNAYSDWLSRI